MSRRFAAISSAPGGSSACVSTRPVEHAFSEGAGNFSQVRPNLLHLFAVAGVIGHDHNAAAARAQQKMMRSGVLIESHRGEAATLERGLFFELSKMLFV